MGGVCGIQTGSAELKLLLDPTTPIIQWMFRDHPSHFDSQVRCAALHLSECLLKPLFFVYSPSGFYKALDASMLFKGRHVLGPGFEEAFVGHVGTLGRRYKHSKVL